MKEGTLYTSVSCTICGIYRGKDTWTTVTTVMNDAEQTEETVPICNGCYKPWLRQYEGAIPYTVIQQQREKKQEKSNVKVTDKSKKE